MNFKIDKCPKCNLRKKLSFSNNPISGQSICFDCINENLDYNNIEHADFFCRTYNLPFRPELWIDISKKFNQDTFEKYTEYMLEEYSEDKINLYYSSSTKDLWAKTNKEWEKTRSFIQILNKITPIKESYIERAQLKWGEQYTFEELIKLDSIYIKTLKANAIVDPLQKEAVKTLCKLQIEMDEAIRAKDAKALKDFSSAYSTFAKEAKLEDMISETRTDDITTVSELYKYMEDSGFKMKFYDNFSRDEVDRTIKDLGEANRRLILESTGLQQTLEDMMKQKQETTEQEHSENITSKETMQEILDMEISDEEIETESDDEIINLDFTNDPDIDPTASGANRGDS